VERRDDLDLLQRRLLDEFESESGRDIAVISKELRAVTSELESLPTGRVSTVDDLAAKRATRRAEATG
jgi:O6-methylguanine-DNA--protein-cysteine methyltransferase